MTKEELLYRAQWFMAHNRLHGVCHSDDMDGWVDKKRLAAQWEEYLAELQTPDRVVSEPG